MRLRLVVRRHNLPDAAVVWSVEPSESPTVSQLLEQVNEVIPLESGGDWGLEDYSVEIKGSDTNFECLHFQLVRTILHDDDEILIRPLLSHDLKLRKVSGRRQISSDGKHLFDGWVFGRPRPRGPVDRPAIVIPPRKRRRITYDEDTDSSFDEDPLSIESQAQIASDLDGNRQLILSADFEDDDEDDEDFEPNEVEEEEDDDDEILDGVAEGMHDRATVDGLVGASDGVKTLANIQNAGFRSDVQKLREGFPKAPISVCENVLVGCDKDIGKAWETLSQAFKPSMPRKAMNRSPQDQETLHPIHTRSQTKAYPKNKKLSLLEHNEALDVNGGGSEPPLLDEDSSLLRYYDQRGLPRGSISTGKDLSNMAKIFLSNNAGQSDEPSGGNHKERISTCAIMSNKSVRFAGGDSGTKTSDMLARDDSDDSEDEDFDLESSIIEPDMSTHSSSDESSDGERNTENNDDSTSSEGNDTSSSDATSNPDSDSDSDSDAEPEEVSSRPTDLHQNAAPETNSITTAPPKGQKTQQNGAVPPGQGKNSTRSRNRRRRIANMLQRYKEKGILPAGATVKEFEQLELDKTRTPEEALQAVAEIRTGGSQKSTGLTEKAAAIATEFETRRLQLLNSLASGGVEVGAQSFSESLMAAPLDSVSKQVEISDKMAVTVAAELETPLASPLDKVRDTDESGDAERDAISPTAAMAITPVESPSQPPVLTTGPTTTESELRPRRKIDLGAAGRLLFGALGVRAPKNKADHEKVRNDLIKDIRPSKTGPSAGAAVTEIESSNVDEDPEAWREVINLRAVECCHEGIELSPAPFPFVQRWDPQQQGSYSKQGNRGGKGKKSQRNQSQYYDNEQQSSKKRKRNRNSYDAYYDSNEQYPAADAAEIEDSGGHDEPIRVESISAPHTQNVYSDGIEGAVNDQIMKDVQEAATSQAMDEDDLPRLPEDISMLPNFTDDDVNPGMVIAFKQLILSEATNWQPQMSTYRTAVVIKASENGNLELRLAKRDREQAEKYYDVETGERIYGKFDMPTDDDQNEEEDDGFLEVTINEIVEPKVVQLAPEGLTAPATSPELAHNKTNTSADDSTTLGHANSAETSKASVEALPEADEEIAVHQDLPVDDTDSPSIRGGDLSTDDPDEILPLSISEDTREEISVLIKEAGFRTSIPSSVLRAQTQLPATPRSTSQKGAYSPRFNGFDSSPSQPIQALSSPSHFDPTTFTHDTHDASEGASENKSTISNVHYPKLSVPSSLASQVSDRGRQPDYLIPGDDTLHQFDELDSFVGVHEELPLNRNEDLLSGHPVNVSDNSPSNHVRSSPSECSEPSSSGVLPTLAEVFSTARSSIGTNHEAQPRLSQKTDLKDAKKIEELYNKEMEALDAMLEEAEDPEQITFKASPDHRKKKSTAPAASQKESGSQFKIPPGSQQVDLTLSSDVELGAEKENVSDDSYDDDYGLPRGPGWVEKKTRRARRQTTGNSQGSSQRVTKTRATRRKTMTKF